ncbi:MAG: hypothetical protein JF586_24105 [Burkholderiales bacterium]|nr:hypothetical protein [Burkholderiales bacterium]
MWKQDWALLGIEPTTELAAIKKAYALKLRVTRPDDDAEAYQALRGAYERAQQSLKREQQSAAEANGELHTPASLLATPEAEAAPLTHDEPSEPASEHVVQARHLIDELELRWQDGGELALMSAWGEVRRELNELPFGREAELSATFARWVLMNVSDLPDVFLTALDSHFSWLNDFRSERLLGRELAYALHQALDTRVRLVTDPGVLALAGPLVGLDAMRKAGGRRWRLHLLSFLMEPTLSRTQKLLGEQCLHRLGLDLNAQHELKEAALRGKWLRATVMTLACMATAMLVLDDAFIGIGRGLVWLLCTGVAMYVGIFIGSLATLLRLAPPVVRSPRLCRQPLLGLAWLLFAAFLSYLAAAPDVPPTAGILSLLPPWAIDCTALAFTLAGLALAWPLDALRSWVVAGLAPLVGFLSMAALGEWLPPLSCLLIGATWILTAAALYEGRLALPESAPLRWLVRPMLNNLALADRWTYSVALLPLSVAIAWAVLTNGQVSALRLFLVWMLSILATGWLQTKADAWGLHQLQTWRKPDAP